MIRVRVELGPRSYEVVVGAGASSALTELLAGRRRAAIVSQPAILDAHGDAVRAAADEAGVGHRVFVMRDGEEHKTLATIDDLTREFARSGLLRGDVVVAFGGGVVGDTAGFAASVYHRGIDVVQVPTTLLAMVDASIGGKTGVNLPEGKNLVGAFHQPIGVLADTTFLATLPAREFASGLGEIAKYTLMERDAGLPDTASLLARDPAALADAVARSAAIKARYVAADEHERTGVRAALNYGHTLGHALETTSGHALLHGEAVAIGLVFAAHLAGTLERIGPEEVRRHEEVVGALGLPTQAPPGLRADDVLAVMQRDKKSSGALTFVLQGPNGIERVDDPDAAAVGKALAAVGVEV